jgi:hypothetical protein
MSASWSVTIGRHTLDVTTPLIGLLAGSCLLLALRGPDDAHAASIPFPLRTRTTATATANGRGTLIGVVQDLQGDPIPGARVVLLGDAGEVLAEERTAADTHGDLALGEFKIDQLPAGSYSVRAESPAAAGAVRSQVIRVPVAAWEDTRVRLHVDMGY